MALALPKLLAVWGKEVSNDAIGDTSILVRVFNETKYGLVHPCGMGKVVFRLPGVRCSDVAGKRANKMPYKPSTRNQEIGGRHRSQHT